jgi:dTDP-4-amino-4,6-dideoxygalactose transaminase
MSSLIHPHNVTKDFEAALCEYTGAKYAVVVTSCTMALLLACKWFKTRDSAWYQISIPRFSYISVPMSIIHAGHRVEFREEEWLGEYQLQPLPLWDSARLFTSGMYRPGQMQCLSFHTSKTLGDTQGGAIIHDDFEADKYLRRMRFDGRTEGVPVKADVFKEVGYHCYISPDVSARLLFRLSVLKRHNDPLPNDDYKDLSTVDWGNCR